MAIEAEKEAPKKKMLAAAGAAAPKNNKANKSKTIEKGGSTGAQILMMLVMADPPIPPIPRPRLFVGPGGEVPCNDKVLGIISVVIVVARWQQRIRPKWG